MHPKVLVLSYTGIGSPNATGQLLKVMFAGWPKDRLLQVHFGHPPIRRIKAIEGQTTRLPKILKQCTRFAPDVMYVRLADADDRYHDIVRSLTETIHVPIVTHTMDDWPSRTGDSPAELAAVDLMTKLIRGAYCNLSICEQMSREYRMRYGREFTAIANGIDPQQWQSLTPRRPLRNRPFTFRYAGALASDMQLDAVTMIAESISRLHSRYNVALELYTMRWCRPAANSMAKSPGVQAFDLVPEDQYQDLLTTADSLIIAYNFDPRSINYTRLSFANKTPECMASGTPILAFGPEEVPTISYLKEHDLALVVDRNDAADLDDAIIEMVVNAGRRASMAMGARHRVFEHHNSHNVRSQVKMIMEHASKSREETADRREQHLLGEFPRSDDIGVDETAVIATMTRNKPGLMIDVGAHHGSAFKRFYEAGWTVHAFEPEPKNFAYLNSRYETNAQLTINQYAISNASGQKLPFYTADESTGIGSLIPFHDQHVQSAEAETITLTDYCRINNIATVRFLKIDTEGNDLFVLQGFPWDTIRPEYIECEFEDAKTQRVGYTFHDLARFLGDRGYHVFVSEWHPIVRYGIPHQWRRLVEYPCDLKDAKSWGNLLAFSERPDVVALAQAFKENLMHRTADADARSNDAPATPSPPGRASDERRKTESATTAKMSSTNMRTFGALSPLKNYLSIFAGFLRTPAFVVSTALLFIVAIADSISTWLIFADYGFVPALIAKLALVIPPVLMLIAYVIARLKFDVSRQEHRADFNGPEIHSSASLDSGLSRQSRRIDEQQRTLMRHTSELAELATNVDDLRAELDRYKRSYSQTLGDARSITDRQQRVESLIHRLEMSLSRTGIAPAKPEDGSLE